LRQPPQRLGIAPATAATVAYLVPWGTNSAARALAAMQRAELRVFSADEAFVIGGREYPAGSLIVKVKANPEDLHARLTAIAAASGAEIVPTDTAWVERGVGLGSNKVRYLKRPVVAIAYGRPASPNSVGWVRFLLERQYDYPVTLLRVRQIAAADLSKYDVLILPAGSYRSALQSAWDSVKAWIRAGGTLITLGEATRWLTEEGVDLLASKREDRERPGDKKSDEGESGDVEESSAKEPDEDSEAAEKKAKEGAETKPFDLAAAILPEHEAPDRTPGAILGVDLDTEHWLAFGYDGDANVLVGSRNIFTPIKLDKGRNVAVYKPADRMVLSGFTWGDVVAQIAQKAYLVHQPHGKGHVVAFAEDPNFRAFCDGLNLLFLNAVFFGPGH